VFGGMSIMRASSPAGIPSDSTFMSRRKVSILVVCAGAASAAIAFSRPRVLC
jgi:hypothetical protein